jgi:hypothetical protein
MKRFHVHVSVLNDPRINFAISQRGDAVGITWASKSTRRKS